MKENESGSEPKAVKERKVSQSSPDIQQENSLGEARESNPFENKPPMNQQGKSQGGGNQSEVEPKSDPSMVMTSKISKIEEWVMLLIEELQLALVQALILVQFEYFLSLND